ncbi:radical S-adenosyl methionine domain-containing protein 2-like [Anoplophora glabripennis]|uniref:radical S-adenosyl methionine domain-containing protein 2-like n=1 Tax=Anoplophora glabripennis TaxID=217634 RepID=UPI000873D2F9|nr:radical S-adenosyl methionine domain-containing protein 2-like [Anoplophora glabripennis]
MFHLLFDFHHILLLLLLLIFYRSLRIINLKHFFSNFKVKEIFYGKVINANTYRENNITPKSVNYHFTRKCNYECGFCFHTAKTSYILDLSDAKKGLAMLKNAGMEKINFSGGEPFLPLKGRHLGEMVKFCKKILNLPSVSIVSNGSMVTEKWFQEYGMYTDIIAISCDSFNENTNKAIGRYQKRKSHLDQLFKIRSWCKQYDVLFKINTVVNSYNIEENMSDEINKLNPIRWKVFQCLLLEGENVGTDALRNASRFYISEEIFNKFIDRHKGVPSLVPESNSKMQNSYLILDEYMRFLDCRNGSKTPSKSILDVGVSNALKFSGFDEAMFKKRGGIYKWSKEADILSW